MQSASVTKTGYEPVNDNCQVPHPYFMTKSQLNIAAMLKKAGRKVTIIDETKDRARVADEAGRAVKRWGQTKLEVALFGAKTKRIV